MSMRDYAVDEYGILLDEETIKLLASKICKDFTEEDYEEDMYSFNDDVVDEFGRIDYISNFVGEAFSVNDDGSDNYRSMNYYNENEVYIFAANKTPSLFKGAYRDMEDLLCEFKSLLANYLPSDFDYRSHLRHFVGTYFG